MPLKAEVIEKVKECKLYESLNSDFFLTRIFGEGDDTRKRNNYQRDYQRIMYSSSFRRLQGKMQLLGVQSDQFYRNRLTHSLEVSQIARSIAEDIGYSSDIYVVEACSLAHDIGNPPFGHYGEKILNKIASGIGGFEGNAQTLRVLMYLEKKSPYFRGLNLTYRTLLGVTKYFKKQNGTNAKFIYNDEYNTLLENIKKFNIRIRTLDVQIIDLADEIAYAAHDLEDTLSQKLFTINELLYEFYYKHNRDKYPNAFENLLDLVKKSQEFANNASLFHSSEEYAFLFRRYLISQIVHDLIEDIDFIEKDTSEEYINELNTIGVNYSKYELGFKNKGSLASGLKAITFECINRTDKIRIYEQQGEKVIKGLFNIFMNYNYYLPVEYRPCSETTECQQKRMIIDYISGMMDSFAISDYIKFYGPNSLDAVYTPDLYKNYCK